MGTLWHEIRHAFRRLGKSPTTTLAAAITLALGIGVATGAYSIIDGLAGIAGGSRRGATERMTVVASH